MLYAMGYRYRLHQKDLPGKPDIVFGPAKRIIFIHGCFWHGHKCPKGRPPKSNKSFWNRKIDTNKIRDRKNIRKLKALGWRVLTVWQCELKDIAVARRRIVDFLD